MRKFRNKLLSVLLVLFVSSVSWADWDNWLDFAVIKYGDSYRAELYGEVEGITSARMQNIEWGDDWEELELWEEEFKTRTDFFSSLAELNADIAGDYRLEFTRGTDISIYSFSIEEILQQWLNGSIQIEAVPAQLKGNYTFQWAWQGNADVWGVEFKGENGHNELFVEEYFWAGEPGFEDTSFNVDFQAYFGPGEFDIFYASVGVDFVVGWSLESGQELFVDTDFSNFTSLKQFLGCQATVSFEVLYDGPVCGDENHPYPLGDLNGDCRVDLADFAILAANWLVCTAPECLQ